VAGVWILGKLVVSTTDQSDGADLAARLVPFLPILCEVAREDRPSLIIVEYIIARVGNGQLVGDILPLLNHLKYKLDDEEVLKFFCITSTGTKLGARIVFESMPDLCPLLLSRIDEPLACSILINLVDRNRQARLFSSQEIESIVGSFRHSHSEHIAVLLGFISSDPNIHGLIREDVGASETSPGHRSRILGRSDGNGRFNSAKSPLHIVDRV
jgi:hypothetical protein